ncbi:MAG: transposase family protein, partial [Planctomycetes bacterium]|nr:transposase family protein [Planctomycetota bacterium]
KFWTEGFGQFRCIHVDNAPGFKSKFFKAVMKAFDCHIIHGQPYVSRTTGRAERSNRRINVALRAALPEGKYKDWDLYLGQVTFALNCLRNRHTSYSANYLVFGRELNTPLSMLAENREEFELIPLTKGDYNNKAYELYRNSKDITRRVRQHANADFCYNAQKSHDRNLKGPYFKEQDEVFVMIQCPSHKLSPRWVGPYKISRKISDHLYAVELPNGDTKYCNVSKL